MSEELDRPKRKLSRKINKRVRQRQRDRRGAIDVDRATAGPRRNDISPDLKLERRPIGELKVPKRNVRGCDKQHVARVIRAILNLGFIIPILIDGLGNVVDGVVRLLAARELNLATVPCLVVDHLAENEIRLLRISINRAQESGSWDLTELKIEFEELRVLDVDLEVTGFEGAEIDLVLAFGSQQAKEDDELPPADRDAKPIVRVGDRFELGPHRLHCADATDSESYNLLLCGEKARLVNTDPPFKTPIVGVVSGKGAHKHEDFVGGFGEMTALEYLSFISSVFAAVSLFVLDGALGFFFTDWRSMQAYLNAGEANHFTLLNVITWNKGRGSMGSLYRSASEFIVLFKFGQGPICNQVQLGRHGRDRTTVWDYPGATQAGSSAQQMLSSHPTPKSVEMIADSILDVTERGDLVLDPFCGSGTSIVAGHKTGRRVYALELEPKFVELAIRRWEKLSGQDAVHTASGLTFSALRAQRLSNKATKCFSGETGGPNAQT
jgi:hypothetical protein